MVTKVNFDLKKAYFRYLLGICCDKNHLSVDYIPLLDLLNSIRFEYVMDRDANREADGEAIREKFLSDCDIDKEYIFEFEDIYVSVLEVLVAIAQRIESQVGNTLEEDRTSERFWDLLRNLDIEKYSADNYKPQNIRDKIEKWMTRKYKKDGSGGIFPLKNPENDQRLVEIWNQMSSYIWENYYEK